MAVFAGKRWQWGARFVLFGLVLVLSLLMVPSVRSRIRRIVMGGRSVETVLEHLSQRHPEWEIIAEKAGRPLTIVVFKHERQLEVYAPGWDSPKKWPLTGFSGTLGPKLREGDGQIPEGIYAVEGLNPNSAYHLSIKLNYPNAWDRMYAKEEGRERPGTNIFIHGSSASVGCVPIGDGPIEELFFIVAKVGISQTRIIVSPYDMRLGRKPELEHSPLPWYPKLLENIAAALQAIPSTENP